MLPLKSKSAFLIIFLALLIAPAFAYSQSSVSPDAIAIKIIPNPAHYNTDYWYKKKEFAGSPQSLVVDGYEAVRDGRTVYVNVANVDEDRKFCSNDDTKSCVDNGQCTLPAPPGTCETSVFTNIYLISYSEDSDKNTVDIFGNILAHWKFNTNIDATGKCVKMQDMKEVDSGCRLDEDCAIDEFCNSQDAELRRDVVRLGDMVEIKEALEVYKNEHGYYPKLNSGTYIPHMTLSVWPSWQDFTKEIGMDNIVDPINKLGVCVSDNAMENAKYDPITCWDEKNKLFSGQVLNPNEPRLPEGSHIYFYRSFNDGLGYELSGGVETEDYNIINEIAPPPNLTNYAPIIDCGYLMGIPGRKFSGYINVSDPEGHKITSITVEPTTPAPPAWPTSLAINNTPISSQKQIMAVTAGNPGNYDVNFTATDIYSASAIKKCTISLTNNKPVVNVSDCLRPIKLNTYYECTIKVEDYDKHQITGINISGNLHNNLTFSYVGGNTAKITGTTTESGWRTVTVTATDEYITNCAQAIFTMETVTWCGDKVIQKPNGEGIFEQCEPPDTKYNSQQAVNVEHQYYCNKECQWEGGYCGDGSIKSQYGEQCEKDGTGKNENDQWRCVNCRWEGGWCGDGKWNDKSPEECDNGKQGSIYAKCADATNPSCFNADQGCVPPYNETCTYCTTQCKSMTVQPNARCGDNYIQNVCDLYGLCTQYPSGYEFCDYGGDNICCSKCSWRCTDPNNTVTAVPAPLSWNSAEGNNLDTVNLSSNQQDVTINFPKCRLKANQGTALAQLVGISNFSSVEIIFVIDTSSSMNCCPDDAQSCFSLNPSWRCPNDTKLKIAQRGLNDSFNALYNAAILGDISIYVGLVSYGSDVYLTDSCDIKLDNCYKTLTDKVSGLSTQLDTQTASALTKTQNEMFNPALVGGEKIIILLSDGEPLWTGSVCRDCFWNDGSCDAQCDWWDLGCKNNCLDPKRDCDWGNSAPKCVNRVSQNIKNNNIKMYTIAYTDNTSLQNIVCNWSNNNNGGVYNAPCPTGTYSYGGTQIESAYENIIENILDFPKGNITFTVAGNPPTTYSADSIPAEGREINLIFNSINCNIENSQQLGFGVSIENSKGNVKLSNGQLNICPSCD